MNKIYVVVWEWADEYSNVLVTLAKEEAFGYKSSKDGNFLVQTWENGILLSEDYI